MKRILLGAALAAAFVTSAFAQSVQQSGSVTPNTGAIWSSTGIIKGGVSATDSPLTTFGVTRDAADGICVSSARSSAAGRNQLCLQAATSGPGKISLQNYGTATAQDLQFVINGTAVTIPTGGTSFVQSSGTLVSGNFPKWSGTSGLVIDSGMTAATGTQYGLGYYTATGAIGSTAAGTNGQIPVATTSGAPAWRTLSGDVSAISAAGAVTLSGVNGVTYPSSYTANGVLYASTSSAVTNIATANTGYCLLSQGLSSAPVWAACASGSGSAGGSTTQVQFNNATSLGGSANLTWVSPALTIGVAGTVTGQLALASVTGASGVVTLQAPGVSSAYNFNFPTGAGSSGQPLISGGGGSTPNTFGTLSVAGGGTNCAVASGTCLDNITGFSGTGYINRTGAGTYANSTVIPVSGGGTNLASGTSGGILGYTASGTLASSVELTQYGLVYGGGAGATPVPTAAGTDGQIPVATTSAAPAFKTLSGDITTVSSAGAVTIANSAISNAKLANSAAYTLKGNFTGSSAAPQDSTMGALTQKASPAAGDYLILQDNAAAGALKYATVSSVASAGSVSSIAGNTGAFTLAGGVTNSTNQIQLDGNYGGFANQNCTLAVSAAASALTIALKDNAGSDPSAVSPCIFNFRSPTGSTGSTAAVSVTAATSLVVSSGSTLGVTSSTAFRLWLVAFNDAGTIRLGVINCAISTTAARIYPLNEAIPASSTAEGGAGAADSAGVFYTGTAVTTKAFRVLGYAEWTPTGVTAGTWTTAALTTLQAYAPGIRLPGAVVQTIQQTSSTATASTTSAYAATNNSQAITLSSAANFIKVSASGNLYENNSATTGLASLFRDSTQIGPTAIVGSTASQTGVAAAMLVYDFPNSVSSITYSVKISSTDNTNSVSWLVGNRPGYLVLEEIQG